MDRPKATQNMSKGIVVSTVPVTMGWPTRNRRCPCWKMKTMAPKLADKLSRLSRIALSGIDQATGEKEQHQEHRQGDDQSRERQPGSDRVLGVEELRPTPRRRGRGPVRGTSRICSTRCSPAWEYPSAFVSTCIQVRAVPQRRRLRGPAGAVSTPPA